jgi:hypothetical protein
MNPMKAWLLLPIRTGKVTDEAMAEYTNSDSAIRELPNKKLLLLP